MRDPAPRARDPKEPPPLGRLHRHRTQEHHREYEAPSERDDRPRHELRRLVPPEQQVEEVQRDGEGPEGRGDAARLLDSACAKRM